MQIIDSHIHVWERELVNISWTHGAGKLDRNFTIQDYLEDTGEIRIESAIYIESNVDAHFIKAEDDYVSKLCSDPNNPLKGAIFYADPLAENFKDRISLLLENPITKGVRSVLHLPEHEQGLCLNNKYLDSLQFLGRKGLSFEVCIRVEELRDIYEVATKCSNTIFVLDHCACVDARKFDIANPVGNGWNQRESDLILLGELDNVYCKLSGITSQLNRNWDYTDISQVIESCINRFSADKLLIGSDFPLCTLSGNSQKWFKELLTILRPHGRLFVEKVCWKNAERLYSI